MQAFIFAFFTLCWSTGCCAFAINVMAGTPLRPAHGATVGSIIGIVCGLGFAFATVPVADLGAVEMTAAIVAACITGALSAYAGISSRYGFKGGDKVVASVGCLASAGALSLLLQCIVTRTFDPGFFEPSMLVGAIFLGAIAPVIAAICGLILGAGPRMVLQAICMVIIEVRSQR